MSTEVNTQESVPEAPLESATEGESADEGQNLLDRLNETLGKEFKDEETALKSVKDTFSYVGKQDDLLNTVKGVMKETGMEESTFIETLKSMSEQKPQAEEPRAETTPVSDDVIPKSQYLEDRFFDKNPELEGIRDYIKPLKNSNDEFKSMSWDDFAGTEAVTKLKDTFTGFEEANSKKSVVESNPRLGAISDKFTQARQAQESGDDATAKSTAVSAVIDTLTE